MLVLNPSSVSMSWHREEKLAMVSIYSAYLTKVMKFSVGIQNARNSQNFGSLSQSLELNIGFDLKPWKRFPNLGARGKNVDL